MSVQTIHFRGEGICENQHFFRTLLNFWLDFIILMGIFSTQKMLMCTLLGGGGRGSQKVYGLYNHENVDIDERPLMKLHWSTNDG